MPKKDKAKIKRTMRRKRARGERIRDSGAYLYGTLNKIKKRRSAKRKRAKARRR